MATHRCKECDALWTHNLDGSWTLASNTCGQCCDNAPMGEQMEPVCKMPACNKALVRMGLCGHHWDWLNGRSTPNAQA